MRQKKKRNMFLSGVGRQTGLLAGLALAGTVLLGVANSQPAVASDEEFILLGHIPIPNLASFDISWVDSEIALYFLADRSNLSVDVIPSGPNPAGLPIGQLFRVHTVGPQWVRRHGRCVWD